MVSNDRRTSNHTFSVEPLPTLKAIKSILKWPYGKENLTLLIISYEIYETRRRFVSKISYVITNVRSSIYQYQQSSVAPSKDTARRLDEEQTRKQKPFAKNCHRGTALEKSPEKQNIGIPKQVLLARNSHL